MKQERGKTGNLPAKSRTILKKPKDPPSFSREKLLHSLKIGSPLTRSAGAANDAARIQNGRHSAFARLESHQNVLRETRFTQ